MSAEEEIQKKQTMTEHVNALRRAIIVSAIAVLLAFAALFYFFCNPIVEFILKPVYAQGIPVISTAVTDALAMKFKVCLVAALVLSSPVIIRQIWSFVSPALYRREKVLFGWLFMGALFLFALGVVFCYTVIFPLTVNLFWEAGNGIAQAMWNVKDYFNFVLSFVVPFGLMFELPVVMYMLARHGVITSRKVMASRKYVILAIAVAAAILTPPDVLSQIMLMIPMIALYEVSVQITRFVKPKAEMTAARESGDSFPASQKNP